MASVGSKKHTHKYHKINDLWCCALPDCTHYMPKNISGNVLGKYSLCWGCGKTFLMDDANMLEDKPTCLACSNPSELDLISHALKEKGLV